MKASLRVAVSPWIGVGPGFDSQGSVNFFTKYCFPNLHRIHVKAFEVEYCEFVPVHHQQKGILKKKHLFWYADPFLKALVSYPNYS